MSDQASRLREAVEGEPAAVAAALRQGPLSIRPRRESELHGSVTLTSVRGPVERPRGLLAGDRVPAVPGPSPRLARAIAVASGKGGVGKTSIAASLAIAMACRRRETWLVDADLGMGNVDVACGFTPRWTLGDVMVGRCRLEEAFAIVEPGLPLRALAAGSGVAGLASMPAGGRDRLLRLLAEAESAADELIVDCGAGVGATTLGFAAAAHEVLLVATPEPASMVDAYGLLKCLVARRPAARVSLVVNQAEGPEEAAAVHRRLDGVARGHLGRSLPLLGVVPRDESVRRAARMRRPLLLADPASPAARAVAAIADRLLGMSDPAPASPPAQPVETDPERGGFLGRVAGWLTRR